MRPFKNGLFYAICELEGGECLVPEMNGIVHGGDGRGDANNEADVGRAQKRFPQDSGEFGVAEGDMGAGLTGQG